MTFTAAALVAIVAFGLLSLWQWHRAEEHRAEFAVVSAAFSGPAQRAATLTDPMPWQHVTATGTFDPSHQFLVRNKPQNGSNGFWVVTLLRSRPRDLWVVRGFLPVSGAAATAVTAPTPPMGVVTVTGYAQPGEPGPARGAADLPAGQITAVDVTDLDATAATETAPWFVIAATDPATSAGVQRIPLPEATDSRNLSYAGQWLLFAAITIGGWYYFLRREARESTQDGAAVEEPAAAMGG